VRNNKANEWIKQAVPHRFNYPVSSAEYSRGRVVIVVKHLVDEFQNT